MKTNSLDKIAAQNYVSTRLRYSLRVKYIGSRLLIWHFLFLSWANIIIHFGFKQAYASILYLHVPDTFRIILRGCDVEPHNVVNDLMYRECVLYKPQIAGLTEVLYKSHLQIMFAFFYHFDCWNKPFHWLILFSIAVSWKRNVCAFSFLEFRMTNGEKKCEKSTWNNIPSVKCGYLVLCPQFYPWSATYNQPFCET